jgi:hypothetical protein
MPPAFVLSQDQTLKFIPDRSQKKPTGQGPPKRSQKIHERPAPRAAVRASLPSLLHPLNQPPPKTTASGVPRPPEGAANGENSSRFSSCPERRQQNLSNPVSDQAEQPQFGQHAIGRRFSDSRPIRRRIRRHKITPPLERPPGTGNRGYQRLIDLDEAITAPVFVVLSAKAGDKLSDPNLTADNPIYRAARENLLSTPGVIPCIDPAAAALRLSGRPKTAQMVDAVDADGELQQVQWQCDAIKYGSRSLMYQARSALPLPRPDRPRRT